MKQPRMIGRRKLAVAVAAVGAVTLAALIAFGPRGADAPPAAAGTNPTVAAGRGGPSIVYLLRADPWSLHVVDPAAGRIQRSIKLKHDAQELAVTPDGRTVIAMGTTGTRLIDAKTGAVRGTIPMISAPHKVQLGPDSRTLYLLGLVAPGKLRLIVVDVADGKAETPVDVGAEATEIALTPDGRTLFVLAPGRVTMRQNGKIDHGRGRLTAIDTATGKAGSPVPLRGYAQRLIFTPDGRTAYAITGTAVTPIDTATKKPGTPIEVPGEPVDIASDGRTVYALCAKATIEDNQTIVAPIDVATNTTRGPITVTGGGTGAHLISLSPGGNRAYVYGGSEVTTIGWIDTTTDTAGPPVALNSSPYRIAFSPDGTTAYILTEKSLLPVNTATGTPGNPIKIPRDSVAIATT